MVRQASLLSLEERKRLAQERGRQKALEKEKDKEAVRQAQHKLEEERKKQREAIEAEERRKREALEAVERAKRAEEEEKQRKVREEEERQRKEEEEEKKAERDKLAALQLEHREEGERLCEEALQAIEKGMLSNAALIVAAAQKEFVQSDLDEEEQEMRLRGLRHKIALEQAAALQRLKEEEQRLKQLQIENMKKMEQEAKRKLEDENRAAKDRAQKEWFRAARHGKHKSIDKMLEDETSGITSADVADAEGNTAMHHAAKEGHKKAVRALLRAHADVNLQNEEGKTPLHLAEAMKQEEVAGYLIEKGADENIRDNEGYTPAMIAEELRKPEKPASAPPPANRLEAIKDQFFEAAERGDATMVRELVAGGIHVDVQDKFSNTALVIGVSVGHLELTKALAELGCNLNASTAKGETALAIARLRKVQAMASGDLKDYGEVVSYLEGLGAGEDASKPWTIHSKAAPERAEYKPKERPTSARPGSGKPARPPTAKKALDNMAIAAKGLFSVFNRQKSQREVAKLEKDMKGIDKANAILSKAEAKAEKETTKATRAHEELMARAEKVAPKVERVMASLNEMKSFDDARAVLSEAKAVRKEAGLSDEAMAELGWEEEKLQDTEKLVKAEADLKAVSRNRRLLLADDDLGGDDSKLRKAVSDAIKTLAPLSDEDENLLANGTALGIALDGDDNLVEKAEKALADMCERLLKMAVQREAKLSDHAKGKKAVRNDVQWAYDALDKALDLAEEAEEKVRLDVQSQTYLEAQRKLKLIETQYANVLF